MIQHFYCLGRETTQPRYSSNCSVDHCSPLLSKRAIIWFEQKYFSYYSVTPVLVTYFENVKYVGLASVCKKKRRDNSGSLSVCTHTYYTVRSNTVTFTHTHTHKGGLIVESRRIFERSKKSMESASLHTTRASFVFTPRFPSSLYSPGCV